MKFFLYLLLAVAGLIASAWHPQLDSERARGVAAKAQINIFMKAIAQYRLDTSDYPTTAQGLNALRKNPRIEGWSGPYLTQDVPNDPWNRPYVYTYRGALGEEPDVVSSKQSQ